MSRLITTIERRPELAFTAFLALHFFVWTVLPALLYPNLPLDLIEALTYGREWQLGYDKLPPLPWWLIEILHQAVGHDFAYYALAQLAVIGAFWLVWLTARTMVGPIRALAAVLIIDGLHYFHFTAAKFNHDVIQLPFWALAGYSLHAALRRGHPLSWALLGLAIGVSLWAKYFIVVLAAPIALFLFVDRDARPCLVTIGPWLALAIALLVMAPHIVWLVENDFLPFAYANARAAPVRGFLDHVWHPLVFAAGQAAFLIPALLIALALFWPQAEDVCRRSGYAAYGRRVRQPDRRGPGIRSGGNDHGVVRVERARRHRDVGIPAVALPRPLYRAARAHGVGLRSPGSRPGNVGHRVCALRDRVHRQLLGSAGIRSSLSRGFYPGDRLGEELARRFRAETGRPLAYVIGSMWDAGNAAHYAKEQPRVLIDGNPVRAPWIDLGDLRSKGAVVVWTDGDPGVIPVGLRRVAADAQVQPPFALPFRRGDGVVTVGWAILRPQPAFARY